MIHWSVHLIQVSDVYIILSMNRTCFFLLTYQVKSKFGPESPRNMGSGTFTVLNYLKRLDWICHMWSQICCRFFLGGAIFRCQNRTAWNVQMTIKCWGTDYRHHRWGHWGLTMFIQYVHISKRLINGQNRSGWFKVTFSSSSWRSLNHLKGALCHPKKVTKKIARFEAFPIVFFLGGADKTTFFCPIWVSHLEERPSPRGLFGKYPQSFSKHVVPFVEGRKKRERYVRLDYNSTASFRLLSRPADQLV